MSVLALMTEAFKSRGGIQEFNRHWLNALAARAPHQNVTVLATGGADVEQGSIRQTVSHGKATYVATAWRAASRLTRSDLILCGHISILPVAVAAARRSGAAVWLQLHGIEAWDSGTWLQQRALNGVTLVTAVSRFTRRRFQRWSGLPPEQIRILPNTFRADCLNQSENIDQDAESCTLLSVGRLHAQEGYKGHDRVIEALPELLRTHPHTLYRIAGEGDDRSRLQALAQRLGVAGQVEFLGAVDRPRLLELYRSSRLYVMPSTGEGFGIVFLEALACGCPAVGLGQDGSADPLTLPGALCVEPDRLAQALCEELGKPRPILDPAEVTARFGIAAFQSQVNILATGLEQMNS